MILILASQWDPAAKALAARWADCGAELLTPRDLSLAGWRQPAASPDGAIAILDGRPVPQREITSVLTRLPCVDPRELLHILPEDRDYIAAEMTAFLLFWLSRLTCPVLNAPVAPCLSGPFWRQEKWVHLASQAGIRARPVHRTVPRTAQRNVAAHTPLAEDSAEDPSEASPTGITVVSQRTFGDADPALHRTALRIAALAHTHLLSVTFSSPERDAQFLAANIFPDLTDIPLSDAVLQRLGAQATHR